MREFSDNIIIKLMETSPGAIEEFDCPATEAFKTAEFFVVESPAVFFHGIDSNIRKMWEGAGEEGPRRLIARVLDNNAEIDLGAEEARLEDLKYLLEQQHHGGEGLLLIDGHANHFLIAGSLVSARYGAWGWDISFDRRIPSSRWWNGGDKLISRA